MTKETLLAADVRYIDPSDCSSSVGYKITEHANGFNAEIELSDCGRKIQWYFSKDTGLQKIDAALEMLSNFRKHFVTATKKRKK